MTLQTSSPKHRVTLVYRDDRVAELEVDESELVADAILTRGLPLSTDCLEGTCGTCRAQCARGVYVLDSTEALTEPEVASRHVLTCQMHARSDCVIELPFKMRGAGEARCVASRVVLVERASSTVMKLSLELDGGAKLSFLAGQYAKLSVPGANVERAYSFANAPRASRLDFYVKIIPGGAMSDYLTSRARPGDAISIRGPYGAFFLREPTRPLLFIAGGTGLAPMLSILETLAGAETSVPMTLLLGANAEDELFGAEALADLARRGLRLDVRRAVMRAERGWTETVGPVTAAFGPELAHGGDCDVYLCGPPAMVEAASALVGERGGGAKVYTEKFVPS